MSLHPLDNPLWHSLTTRHREIAVTYGGAVRYPAPYAPFLAIPAAGEIAAATLAALVARDETVYLVGPQPIAPPGWEVRDLGLLFQMICERPLAPSDGPAVVALGAAHRDDVLALTQLVYPHFFREQTMELGRYFGIYIERRLAAMIGERMGVPGHREISAVCTHPDFVGRGLARHLLIGLANDLLERGRQPFLHVTGGNERAIRLYEQNGFHLRIHPAFWSLRRVASEK